MKIKKRVHVIYEGRVQGVGFRYTAVVLAKEFHITGWVKNLYDASEVELVAEGDFAQLNLFLVKIKRDMSRYIVNENIEWEEYQGSFDGFDIRF
ncbi:MAG: acylphosphatase [Candidatus Omnitrophota bacterium]